MAEEMTGAFTITGKVWSYSQEGRRVTIRVTNDPAWLPPSAGNGFEEMEPPDTYLQLHALADEVTAELRVGSLIRADVQLGWVTGIHILEQPERPEDLREPGNVLAQLGAR